MSHRDNDLTAAMRSAGGPTVESFPPCTACGEDVKRDAVQALNLPYHRTCLRCTRCKAQLEQGAISEYKSRPHCTDCFAFLNGKKCARCGEGAAHAIKAMDKSWHKQCFTCAFCHEALSGAFVEEGGKPYHEQCIRRQETATAQEKEKANAWELLQSDSHLCQACKTQVPLGEGISIKAPYQGANYAAGTGRYYFHEQCFNCSSCHKKMTGQFVVTLEGYWCESCAARNNKSAPSAAPCARCGRGLEGRLLKALGKEYHADCFVCNKCSRAFPNGEFVDVNGRPTCEACANN